MHLATNKPLPIDSPDWPIPDNVRAVTTHRGTRLPGNAYSSFNLGLHVNDTGEYVTKHRQALTQSLHIPNEPHWLDQIHGTKIITLNSAQKNPKADGSTTQDYQQACVILTADCLPILMTNIDGTQVAAIHAGWRGLLLGIVDRAIEQFHCPANELLVWLGPCIGPLNFEINATIRQQFIQTHSAWDESFHQNDIGSWFAHLQRLAETRLQELGVEHIHKDTRCTFEHRDTFYSYRRDGQYTGRMAHAIWLEES
ncbi:MAG: hypothetical protein CL816_00945 [Coxiellaceae bacterium]|nr:hypothetical protein [Coxiellaceae bacterium]